MTEHKEAIEAGVSHLRENRAEGFQDKYTAIGDQVHWHFIGTLQSRKVKEIVHQVDFIHSLDRKSLAKEINKRAEKTNLMLRSSECKWGKFKAWIGTR